MSTSPPSGPQGPGSSSNPYAASAPATPFPQGSQPYASPPSVSDNTVGLVGFILALIGIFMCPMALIGGVLGFIGRKQQPNGLAVAAMWIGGVATGIQVLMACGYVAMIATVLGVAGTVAATTAIPMMNSANTLVEANTALQNEYEKTGEVLTQGQADAVVTRYQDGWGNALRYDPDPDGQGFTLRSAGPDQVFDTGDDLTVPSGYGVTVDFSDVDGDTGVQYDDPADATFDPMEDFEIAPEPPTIRGPVPTPGDAEATDSLFESTPPTTESTP